MSHREARIRRVERHTIARARAIRARARTQSRARLGLEANRRGATTNQPQHRTAPHRNATHNNSSKRSQRAGAGAGAGAGVCSRERGARDDTLMTREGVIIVCHRVCSRETGAERRGGPRALLEPWPRERGWAVGGRAPWPSSSSSLGRRHPPPLRRGMTCGDVVCDALFEPEAGRLGHLLDVELRLLARLVVLLEHLPSGARRGGGRRRRCGASSEPC